MDLRPSCNLRGTNLITTNHFHRSTQPTQPPSYPTAHPLTRLLIRRLARPRDRYLEKKNDKKIWQNRWFVATATGGKELTLSWHKKPGTPAINDMVMTCGNDEEYAYIREAKEKVVQDDVTGEYYLLKEFPNMTPAKLKGKGANVLVIMTKARKFKLRGESTPYIIKWANRLNELLKTTQTVGGMWNDEEETTRDDSVFTRTASMVSHDSRASSGTMETHNEAGTDEELEDVEPYNEHDPDVVEGGELRDCHPGTHGVAHHEDTFFP